MESNKTSMDVLIFCGLQAADMGYYFVASTQQALERNRQRAGKAQVPPVAIYSAAAKLIPSTYAEGYNALYYVHTAEDSTATALTWRIEEII